MAYDAYSSNSIPIDKRMSTLSLSSKHRDGSEFAINRFSQKYEAYQDYMYGNSQQRRRLSSTGEGSGDSSTTASGSSCGEREDGSEGRAESEENERDERKPPEGQITESERLQIESFFKGLKTQVFVTSALANLYTRSAVEGDWQLKYTGIPVVILDVGESRARNKRMVRLALAERGTCFMLWSDTLNHLSQYQVTGTAWHTMCYSKDHTLQVGFSFDTQEAANEIWLHIDRLMSCPENISLSTPGKKPKKKKEKKQAPLPPKNQISYPCCFQHVTSVDSDDITRYFSLKELLPSSLINRRMQHLEH